MEDATIVVDTIDYTANLNELSMYLHDILYTMGQVEAILWFFVFVTASWFVYRFLRVFL